MGLQVATVHVPVMNEAFSTAPLSLQQWAICAGLSLSVPAAIELCKSWLRAADRRG